MVDNKDDDKYKCRILFIFKDIEYFHHKLNYDLRRGYKNRMTSVNVKNIFLCLKKLKKT